MNHPVDWEVPPAAPALADGEVHVWRIGLQLPPSRMEQLQAMLDAGETQRAARFYFDKDRRRFIVAHAAMRMILGAYLQLDPAGLQLGRNAYGKPELQDNRTAVAVRFNLSHSGELALFAVARDRNLGVDVEQVRPVQELLQLAQRFFTPQEVNVLRQIPAEGRLLAFFNCWTRKEAFIKANGMGLSLPLDQFEVTCAPGEPARLLRHPPAGGELAPWSLHAFTPAEGYVAALAVQGELQWLKCWQWREQTV
ncbi:MAG: 4'-phosphopantetheinyl transferase superfamily protein [candidate division KSB1 bacterium]|nr:4'-phosphopantetheinyl transferase superfamily protein [candidate division KSB1 bacterium]MDZ7276582.1 4'-phosphopantetheinyl transferase superfamily protein [candidate division KSB1 bacterium]MDZ7288245.1 4'-phosphopantetheinyl transferase superfamily protein [candidate division KSB1 bacterium]MDZ7300364.1 4'-phosphopantetheinyl transferase superfamily protein [candidate division KSB1 bacterium]MDZ7309245.1 4'-phosphopantetheinyl transferase superfamily protein [candidate division KSB1 bact